MKEAVGCGKYWQENIDNDEIHDERSTNIEWREDQTSRYVLFSGKDTHLYYCGQTVLLKGNSYILEKKDQ